MRNLLRAQHTSENKIKILQDENSAIRSNVAALENRAKIAERSLEECEGDKAKLIELKTECEALRTSAASLSGANKIILESKARLEEEVVELTSLLTTAREALEASDSEIKAAKKDAAALQAAADEARTMYAALKESASVASQEASEAFVRQRDLVDEKEALVHEARARIAVLEGNLAEYIAKLEAEKRATLELQGSINVRMQKWEEEKGALLSKISLLVEGDRESQQEAKKDYAMTFEVLSKERDDAREKANELSDLYKASQQKVQAAEERLKDIELEKSAILIKIEASRQQQERLDKEHAGIIQVVADERDDIRKRLAEVSHQLVLQQQNLASGEQMRQDLESDKRVLLAKVESLEETVKKERNDANTRASELEQQVTFFQHKAVTAEQKWHDAESTMNAMEVSPSSSIVKAPSGLVSQKARDVLEALGSALGDRFDTALDATMLRIDGLDSRLRSVSSSLKGHVRARSLVINTPQNSSTEELRLLGLLDAARRQCSDLNSDRDTLLARQRELQNQLRASEEECRSLRSVVTNLENAKDASKRTVSAAANAVGANTKVLSEEVVAMRKQAQSAKMTRNICAERSRAKSCELQTATNERAKGALQVKRLEAELARTKLVIEELQCAKESSETILRDDTDIVELQRELNLLKKRSNALQSERDALAARVRDGFESQQVRASPIVPPRRSFARKGGNRK